MKIEEIATVCIEDEDYQELEQFLLKHSKNTNWNNSQLVRAYIEPVNENIYLDKLEGMEFFFSWETRNYRRDGGYYVVESSLNELLEKLEIVYAYEINDDLQEDQGIGL